MFPAMTSWVFRYSATGLIRKAAEDLGRVAVHAEVAERREVAVELVDSVCDVRGLNPALVQLRKDVAVPDAVRALEKTIAGSVAFWSSESPVLDELYGVVAVDPAARNLVDRQRRDRRGELERLVENLARSGRLAPGVSRRDVLVTLLLMTSFETYRELREAGLTDRQAVAYLQRAASRGLLAAAG